MYIDTHRRTGRTTRMLEQAKKAALTDSVAVVVATYNQARQLQQDPVINFLVQNKRLDFYTPNDPVNKIRGKYYSNIFVDHYVWYIYPDSLQPKKIEFLRECIKNARQSA